MENNFLAETALLGQGLYSCDNDLVRKVWLEHLPEDLRALAWLWQGEIIIGTVEEFLAIRNEEDMGRYNMYNLPQAMAGGKCGFLTAGCTMKIAADLGKKYVVSCGIGGIYQGVVSSDLPALCSLPVVLVATSPKDMLKAQPILDYLHAKSFGVYGWDCDETDGYLFVGDAVKLDGRIDSGEPKLPDNCCLLLNPLPKSKRLTDRRLLAEAVEAGQLAADQGRQFHPAVNRALDRLSHGKTSENQLVSFVENIKFVYEKLK